MIRVGVAGLGLIGRERLQALQALRAEGRALEIVGAVDPHNDRATQIASDAGVELVASADDLHAREPDWVIVATPHSVAVELVPQLLRRGVRVLVEKPLGRNRDEARSLAGAQIAPEQLWVGMNYRFYAGVASLLADAATGCFGEPVGCSVVLGHGGSPGDELSWKLDPVKAGGGALIDPGVHVLDLLQLLGGELTVKGAGTWSGFWKTGIEEECHLLFKGSAVPALAAQISIVRWRSTFELALYGTEGYGVVEGRNRSYGPQTYRRGRRWGWQGGTNQADSEELVVADPSEDVFARELDSLLLGAPAVVSPASAAEAVATMELLDRCRGAAGLQVPTFSAAAPSAG